MKKKNLSMQQCPCAFGIDISSKDTHHVLVCGHQVCNDCFDALNMLVSSATCPVCSTELNLESMEFRRQDTAIGPGPGTGNGTRSGSGSGTFMNRGIAKLALDSSLHKIQALYTGVTRSMELLDDPSFNSEIQHAINTAVQVVIDTLVKISSKLETFASSKSCLRMDVTAHKIEARRFQDYVQQAENALRDRRAAGLWCTDACARICNTIVSSWKAWCKNWNGIDWKLLSDVNIDVKVAIATFLASRDNIVLDVKRYGKALEVSACQTEMISGQILAWRACVTRSSRFPAMFACFRHAEQVCRTRINMRQYVTIPDSLKNWESTFRAQWTTRARDWGYFVYSCPCSVCIELEIPYSGFSWKKLTKKRPETLQSANQVPNVQYYGTTSAAVKKKSSWKKCQLERALFSK